MIIEGGNDYIVTVKGNQPRLLAQLETKAECTQPYHRFVDVEKTRGRITCRIVNVFLDLSDIDLDWVGLQSLTTGCGFCSLGEFVWKPLDTWHSIDSS